MLNPRVKSALAWLLATLLGLSFLAAGWPKIIPNDSMVTRFENWGYSAEFAVVIGILEIAAGLIVFVPRLAPLACALIAILMLGAVYTHVVSGIGSAVFALIYLAMAAALGWFRFPEAVKLIARDSG